MSEPFIGQISTFAFAFPPRGWAVCDGALLGIQQNQALYALLGTQFGGNGTSNFALPDLRGKVAMHAGAAGGVGQVTGEEQHTLTVAEVPAQSHLVYGVSEKGTATTPANNYFAGSPGTTNTWGLPTATPGSMAAGTVNNEGGNAPHENRMPYLAVNFCIATIGVWPSRD